MPLTYQIREKRSSGGSPQQNRYIEITGFEGTIRALRIPEQIEGLPVGRIASRAFADRADLEEVYLPAGLKALGPFAFYNSPRLSYLALADGIDEYNDGVIRHCRGLKKIEITMCAAAQSTVSTRETASQPSQKNRMPREEHAPASDCAAISKRKKTVEEPDGESSPNYELLRRLLADNDRKLRLLVHMPDGDFSLVFPEYLVDFQEDTFARAFHFRIEGGGYASRECITRKGIDFAAYDAGFYQATVDDRRVAAEVAFERLLYPYALREEHREQYEQYLRDAAGEVLPDLIRDGEEKKIGLLTERKLLEAGAVSDGIRIASEAGRSQICASLLSYQNTQFPAKKKKSSFLLEDW